MFAILATDLLRERFASKRSVTRLLRPSANGRGPTSGLPVTSNCSWRGLNAEYASRAALIPSLEKETTMKPAKKGAQKSPKSTAATGKQPMGLTDEERAAIREHVQELKTGRAGKTDGESDVLAKIAGLSQPDRVMAERLHAIIKTNGPTLSPRTWYGMPAYAKDGNVVCFFQSSQKFKTRYATLGFSDKANLDEGHMWPTSFALKELSAAEEVKIGALVKKAVS